MQEAPDTAPTVFRPFRPCRKCHRQREEHLTNGKCLYGPDWFAPVQGPDFIQDWVDRLYREWERATH